MSRRSQNAPRRRSRSHNHDRGIGASAPTFEALEPRVLLSSTDLMMFGMGLGAPDGDVQMYGLEPGGGPLAVHAAVAGDAESGADASGGVTGVLIDGVPAYTWYRGCGPTAVGMMIGYWDARGFENLVEGSAAGQTAAVNRMMASPEHYADYSTPLDNRGTGILDDKSDTGGAHEDNCVADFMLTSFSVRNNYYGWSWFSNVDDSLEDYFAYTGYSGADARNLTWSTLTWANYTAEIDAGRPVGLIVDTNADGWTDHFITGIGYDEATNRYGAYNTWDRNVHWYEFAEMTSGQSWGVYGATFFDPGVAAEDAIAPTADLTIENITTPAATHTFSVVYADNVAVDRSDIGSGDVAVTGPNGYEQVATLVSVDSGTDGSPITATYRITAPEGEWALADNGTYTVSLRAGQVSDTSGNLAASGTLGTFAVEITDTVAPVADLTIENITTPAATHTFSVVYADNVAVDRSDIGTGDVAVTGPNGYEQIATLVSVDSSTDGSPITATYRITAPEGEWALADNGTYTVSLRAGEVSDTSGNLAASGTLGTFAVEITDTVAPTADLIVTGIQNSGATTHTFRVVYADNVAVDRSDIGSGDVAVTGPNGYEQVATLVSVDSGTDSSPITATYRITAPEGEWDLADNGTYTVSLRAGQVSDTSGNLAASGTLGTFAVNIADTVAPVADLTVENITTPAATHTFRVVYADNVAVDRSDIGTGDVAVTGPNGYEQVATLVSVDSGTDGSPITATYRITAPEGEWDLADNGTYTVSLRAGQVSDTSGNLAASGTLGTFAVEITDTVAPTADLDVSNITTPAATHTFSVVYADNVAVDRSDIGSGDVQVTGPNGYSQIATLVSVDAETDASPITATYRITGPGGEWAREDSGVYTVSLRAGQVSDTSGNLAASGTLGTFQVAIADATAPVADLTIENITTPAATHTFSVVYADNVAVDRSDIGTGDVVVTGPNGYEQIATLVSVDSGTDGSPITATYRITAPEGEWGQADNGVYSVLLRAGQVSDTSGNLADAGALGTFQVAIADATAPVADLTIENITTPGDGVHTFRVVYADNVAVDRSDIGTGDVVVTGPNDYEQVATLVSVDAETDASPITATYRITGPGGEWARDDSGVYTVSLRAGQVSDTSGNLADAGALGTFQVAIADAVAPTAELIAKKVTHTGTTYTFKVTFSDDEAVDVSDLDNSDVVVIGPNGYEVSATLVDVDVESDGTPRTATYRVVPPGGAWDHTDNGTYTVLLRAGAVSDTTGNSVASGSLGTFLVSLAEPGRMTGRFKKVTGASTAKPGSSLSAPIALTNGTGGEVSGTVNIILYASTDDTLGDGDVVLATLSNRSILVGAGESIDLALSTAVPGDLAPGQYHLLAVVDINGLVGELESGPGTLVAEDLLSVAWRFGTINGRTTTLSLPAGRGLVTFSLKGSGYATIEGESGFERIVLSGTNSRSSLRITSKTGNVEVGDLVVDGSVRSLSLRGVTLTGDVDISGSLGRLRLTSGLSDAVWTIGGRLGKVIISGEIDNWTLVCGSDIDSLRLGKVVSADLDVDGHIARLMATEWSAGSIVAESIGSLSTRVDKRTGAAGHFGADATLTGPTGGRDLALGSARISGHIVGATWDIAGNAGRLQVGWWGAGSSLSVAQQQGQGAQFASGAGAIASLRIGGYDAENDGVAFGIAAANFGKGVRLGRAKLSAGDLPFTDGDFQMARL